MKNQVLIGCSSFNNRLWKGIFYPDSLSYSKLFEFYCQSFSSYEFNGSFYRFPTVRIFENWYNKTPENFIFSVKAPKEITHLKKFIDCEERINEFYKVCKAGFREKLGCILFQFPPSYHFSEEKLQNIINNLDVKFKNVIEFRHESWWNQKVWDAFRKHDITFCSVSHPQLPDTIFTDFPLIYVRLHGKPKMFYSSYSSEELLYIKDAIILKSAFLYFNNTASEAGILNALALKHMLE